MLTTVEQDEQYKIEEPGYRTYWDKSAKKWMMAEWIEVRCEQCDGSGKYFWADDDENDECMNCWGSGYEDALDTDNAVSCEDFKSVKKQEWYLWRKYGTSHPRRINDYWCL